MNKQGVQRLFEAIQIVPSTRELQVTSAPLRISREKILPGPEKSKNFPKTAKIEGYTRFRTISGSELRTPRDASYGHGRSQEKSHVVCNEYMDDFTFISINFKFHEK